MGFNCRLREEDMVQREDVGLLRDHFRKPIRQYADQPEADLPGPGGLQMLHEEHEGLATLFAKEQHAPGSYQEDA